jgi:hypothetical protein
MLSYSNYFSAQLETAININCFSRSKQSFSWSGKSYLPWNLNVMSPCPQKPATGPYAAPDESSPLLHILTVCSQSCKTYINSILSILDLTLPFDFFL